MAARTLPLNTWGKDALASLAPPVVGALGFALYAPHFAHPLAPSLFLAFLTLLFIGAGLHCAHRLRGWFAPLAALVLGGVLGGAVAAEIIDWHSGGAAVSPGFRAMLVWLGAAVFWLIAVVVDLQRYVGWRHIIRAVCREWGAAVCAVGLYSLAINAGLL